ncbi:MAG: mechanosensitive ion channel family protein [Syntrophales bacterium]|nr:mechanosensitive ion channel family protein [Syntrophales bacterium]
MDQLIEKTNIALPALAMIAGGFLAGVIIEKVIFARVKKIIKETDWSGGKIIISCIHGMVMLWCVIAGAHAALYNLPLSSTLFNFFQKSLVIITIFTVTIVAERIAVGFIGLYSRGAEGILPAISISSNITKLIIYLVGLLFILQTLGISVVPILTALGVGGLAVALALKDTLANLFAGLHILLSKQIKAGDYIKLNTGEEGYVTDITWRNTAIRTIPNNLIIVPNANLASATITNFNLPEKDVPVRVQVGVSYASDLEKVEKVALDVARKIMEEMGAPDSEPAVRYQTFGDSSINLTVIMRAKEFADQYMMAHEFIKRLHRRFHEEGIEIPFPIRTLYVKKET